MPLVFEGAFSIPVISQIMSIGLVGWEAGGVGGNPRQVKVTIYGQAIGQYCC